MQEYILQAQVWQSKSNKRLQNYPLRYNWQPMDNDDHTR